MKALITFITLLLLTLPTYAADEMKPLDKDIPLSEGVRQANELFPDRQPLTEDEVIAAVKAIKLTHPDMKEDVYDTYMRVVNERVLPKGMYFRRIALWNTEYGRFQVDWEDLCLQGRVATERERSEILSRMPFGMKSQGEVRVGGFAYRIRARFVSVDESSPSPGIKPGAGDIAGDSKEF
jgi:hypothetical protein